MAAPSIFNFWVEATDLFLNFLCSKRIYAKLRTYFCRSRVFLSTQPVWHISTGVIWPWWLSQLVNGARAIEHFPLSWGQQLVRHVSLIHHAPRKNLSRGTRFLGPLAFGTFASKHRDFAGEPLGAAPRVFRHSWGGRRAFFWTKKLYT